MEELSHYGVKGMHWGVRRAEKKAETKARKAAENAPHPDYNRSMRYYDRTNHGSGGVKRINRRLNQGHDLKTARKMEYSFRRKRNAAIKAGVVLGPFVAEMATKYGQVAVQGIAVRAETKRGQAFLADSMGLPSRPTNGPTYNRANRKGVYNITSL